MTDSLTMPTSPPMTGTQASLYQQLRGHLATLKLTAVAEHLPGVLAQAEAVADLLRVAGVDDTYCEYRSSAFVDRYNSLTQLARSLV